MPGGRHTGILPQHHGQRIPVLLPSKLRQRRLPGLRRRPDWRPRVRRRLTAVVVRHPLVLGRQGGVPAQRARCVQQPNLGRDVLVAHLMHARFGRQRLTRHGARLRNPILHHPHRGDRRVAAGRDPVDGLPAALQEGLLRRGRARRTPRRASNPLRAGRANQPSWTSKTGPYACYPTTLRAAQCTHAAAPGDRSRTTSTSTTACRGRAR